MVICKSYVVPASLPGDDGSTLDASSFLEDADSLFLGSRPSRPVYDDEEWKGHDLYSDDAPIEEVTTRWNEKHTKMEPILVNGAKRQHWTMGQNEI